MEILSDMVELVLFESRSITYNLEAFEVLANLIQIAGFFLGFLGVLANGGAFGTFITMVANAIAEDIRRHVGNVLTIFCLVSSDCLIDFHLNK